MGNNKERKKVNLALQGGGAHGAFTWGALDYLLEHNLLEFPALCATSAGTMNATIFAYNHAKHHGDYEKIREGLHNFWFDISKTRPIQNPWSMLGLKGYGMISKLNFSILDVFSHIMSPYQFNPYNVNILREIVESNVDFEELKRKQDVKLFISATNVRTGKLRVFTNEDISIDVVMASACLPYLFQAVKVKDDYYWDGGYVGNPALFPLFYDKNCAQDILIVHINPVIRSKLPIESGEIMNRINEITFNSSLISEYRAVAFVNKMLNEDWIKKEHREKLRHVHLHAIRADLALQAFDISTKFNTSWEFLEYLKLLGRIEARKWAEKNLGFIGKKTTVELDHFLSQAEADSHK